jgi:alternate signal-mediated exported protein
MWFGQGRTRALMATGILFGLGATATYAYWSDSGTVTAGPITSGTLDMTARDSAGGSDNLQGTGPNNWNYTAFSISDLIPGESMSKTLVVRNSGNAPFRINATVASSNNNLTSGSNGLQVIIFDNSTAGIQTGTQAGGNRGGPCSGGTQVYSGYVSTTQSANLYTVAASPQLPNTGDTRSYCVRAILDSSATNSLQTKSTNVVISLSAAQLGSP